MGSCSWPTALRLAGPQGPVNLKTLTQQILVAAQRRQVAPLGLTGEALGQHWLSPRRRQGCRLVAFEARGRSCLRT